MKTLAILAAVFLTGCTTPNYGEIPISEWFDSSIRAVSDGLSELSRKLAAKAEEKP